MRDNKIYTKKGDKGQTSTFGGKMSKADNLAEALGTIDELNSFIGMCRIQFINSNNQISSSKQVPITKFKITNELKRIQNNLMTINAIIAGNKDSRFGTQETGHLEELIDRLQGELPELKNFIYPAGELQFARAVARRAERAVVVLNNQITNYKSQTNHNLQIANLPNILKYLNRLSDALFVMGRWVNMEKGIKEEVWKN